MKSLQFFSVICLVGMMTIFTNACSKADPNNPAGGGGDSSLIHRVTIQATQFQPATIFVLPGSKITWTNNDTVVHSVTSNDGISFSSGNINPQGTYTYTAGTLGTFPYHCNLHPSMQGTINVVTR